MTLESSAKWFLLVLVALISWTWISFAGFRVDPGYFTNFGWIGLLLSVALFYFHTGRDQRIVDFAHFGAQLLCLYALLSTLNYLLVSTNAPLANTTFDAIDKSLGLDWVAWTTWMTAHPTVRIILQIAYDSLPLQALFCYIYNVYTRANWRNYEIWWITFISGVVTILISGLVPATNPYVYYGLEDPDHFVHMQIFLGLRDGTMEVLKLSKDEGLIQLPSFHTILAIMFTYNLRQNRWLFAIAAILNTLLILSCPTAGCHYFIDIPAGIVVAAATIWFVRRLARKFAWQQPLIVAHQPIYNGPLLLER